MMIFFNPIQGNTAGRGLRILHHRIAEAPVAGALVAGATTTTTGTTMTWRRCWRDRGQILRKWPRRETLGTAAGRTGPGSCAGPAQGTDTTSSTSAGGSRKDFLEDVFLHSIHLRLRYFKWDPVCYPDNDDEEKCDDCVSYGSRTRGLSCTPCCLDDVPGLEMCPTFRRRRAEPSPYAVGPSRPSDCRDRRAVGNGCAVGMGCDDGWCCEDEDGSANPVRTPNCQDVIVSSVTEVAADPFPGTYIDVY